MADLHLCTYFDHRYLSRGIALHGSLIRNCKNFTLWVLCLTPQCYRALEKLKLPNVVAIPLEKLEAADPKLFACKSTRSTLEYFMTCSPCLPWYLLASEPLIKQIHYVDADLFFFSDPQRIVDIIGNASVAITPHRFPKKFYNRLVQSGEYNVGWLSFRRDHNGLACLAWWRERCIEWCYSRLEPDRYADQKYLEQFEALFDNVISIENKGINLAPWNIINYKISVSEGKVVVDSDELIVFHFSALKKIMFNIYRNNLRVYSKLTGISRSAIYKPYLLELKKIDKMLRDDGIIISEDIRTGIKPLNLKYKLRMFYESSLGSLIALFHGNIIRG